MGDFQFNVSLGREVELYKRVDDGDPSGCALLLVVLALAGLETDDVLKQKVSLADVVSGTTAEATNSGYGRILLDGTDLSAYSVDHANGRILLSIPPQTFSGIAVGDSWRKVLVCYVETSGSYSDSEVVPITAHDTLINGSAIVPNTEDILIDLSAGFCYARQAIRGQS